MTLAGTGLVTEDVMIMHRPDKDKNDYANAYMTSCSRVTIGLDFLSEY